MSLARPTCCLTRFSDGQRMGDWKMVDTMIVDGLWDVYNQYHMGITAENVAKQYGITRDMGCLALASQQKSRQPPRDAGKFVDEIVGVSIPRKKGDPVLFNVDRVPQPQDQCRSPSGLRPRLTRPAA